jgi:hypothetical protein
MSPEEDVLAALRALADADREREAPPEVEGRLRTAFRKKRRTPVWLWAMAAAAAIVVTMATTTSIYFRPRPVEPSRAVVDPPKVVQPAQVVVSEPRPAQVVRARRSARPQEITTDFFPLVDVAPPLDRGELVRVSLPAAAMRTVGLPVREDRLSERIQADVLVSEEGLATAIRFVKFQ